MNVVVYREKPNGDVKVYLGAKLIGTIERVKKGWCYFTHQSRHSGEVFQTLREVKRSLEED